MALTIGAALQFRFEFSGQFTNARIMNWDFGCNARDESLHRNSAFNFALPDRSRKFDHAQFEVNDPRGIFDSDFRESARYSAVLNFSPKFAP